MEQSLRLPEEPAPAVHSVDVRGAEGSRLTIATEGRVALPALVIVAATIVLYWPALRAGFVGDDFMILQRLRGLTAPADAIRFFTTEFFGYYRPLGFVSHALDWIRAGADPGVFHLTNILLHCAATVFVLLIAQALSPRSLAGALAALMFAFHASNHEAVVWMSARFDLLATTLGLAAVCWLVRSWPGSRWAPALLFFPALLSKESVVALPLVALAWGVFVSGESARGVAARGAAWLGALCLYSVLREVAGGVSALGGASRVPKLAVLASAILILFALSDGRWQRLRRWLLPRRDRIAGVAAVLLTALLLGALLGSGRIGALLAEKLSVAAFAVFYLTTPVLDSGWAVFSTPASVVFGAAALALVAGLILAVWRPVLMDARLWFVAVLLFATLLPISALTEGKRYLYLPSAAVSILLGVVVAELRGRSQRIAVAAAGIVLAVSAVQVHYKIRDWIWAGTMTANGARMVDQALAPSCNEGHVVFLTSPVGVRAVYTHYYYETFALSRGCIPEVFQVVMRVQRQDAEVNAGWAGPSRIVMTVPDYAGQFVTSADLRTFDLPIPMHAGFVSDTPLGTLRADPAGRELRLTLTLTDEVRRAAPHFFYYSGGAVHQLR